MAKNRERSQQRTSWSAQSDVRYVGQYEDVTPPPSSGDDKTPTNVACIASETLAGGEAREPTDDQEKIVSRTWTPSQWRTPGSDNSDAHLNGDIERRSAVFSWLRRFWLFSDMKTGSSVATVPDIDAGIRACRTGSAAKPAQGGREQLNATNSEFRDSMSGKTFPLRSLMSGCLCRLVAFSSLVGSPSFWSKRSTSDSEPVDSQKAGQTQHNLPPSGSHASNSSGSLTSRSSVVHLTPGRASDDTSCLQNSWYSAAAWREAVNRTVRLRQKGESLHACDGGERLLTVLPVKDPWALVVGPLSSTTSSMSPSSSPSECTETSCLSLEHSSVCDQAYLSSGEENPSVISAAPHAPVCRREPSKWKDAIPQEKLTIAQGKGVESILNRPLAPKTLQEWVFGCLCSAWMALRGGTASLCMSKVFRSSGDELRNSAGKPGADQTRLQFPSQLGYRRRSMKNSRTTPLCKPGDTGTASVETEHCASIKYTPSGEKPILSLVTRQERHPNMSARIVLSTSNLRSMDMADLLRIGRDFVPPHILENRKMETALRRELRGRVLKQWFQRRLTRLLALVAVISLLLLVAQFLSVPVCIFGGVFLLSAGGLVASFFHLIRFHGLAVTVSPHTAQVLEEARLLDLLYVQLSSGRHSFYISRLLALLFSNPTPEEALALLEGWHPFLVKVLTTRGVVHAMPRSVRRAFYGTGEHGRKSGRVIPEGEHTSLASSERGHHSKQDRERGCSHEDTLDNETYRRHWTGGALGRICINHEEDQSSKNGCGWKTGMNPSTATATGESKHSSETLNDVASPESGDCNAPFSALHGCIGSRTESCCSSPALFSSPEFICFANRQGHPHQPPPAARGGLETLSCPLPGPYSSTSTPSVGRQAEEERTKTTCPLSIETAQGLLSRQMSPGNSSDCCSETGAQLVTRERQRRGGETPPWSREVVLPPLPAHEFVPSFDAYYKGRDLKKSVLESRASQVVSQLGLRVEVEPNV
ncbi:hypothetical protein BESB_066150 [Besnoitia besnoiti]|uniref:Transmembrane protein n=1 Tax=Besnoitia besnoiti TaxID=94643 RepID=A0A2A9MGQ6_BESBE|nr:hypothetical protein BESB_066150 [Besnoitia besnoiti]PFH34582.1 hypothetical protein BESB_066150 [Besnoitia besnoiti]